MREAISLAPVTLDQRARAKIHSWIATSGATQAEVAIRIGRTPGWLSRYLNADFDADLETLRAFAAAFQLPFGALFDEPGDDPAETRLIEHWRALPPESRAMLSKLAELWARPLRRSPRGAGRRR
jgi:transcriptional regulator with XRE-family HTH domain